MTDAGSDARPRVLLIDDSVLVLRIASAYLSADYEVITASSGEEALGKAVAERPDLILMDLHMAGVTGAEAADWLRQDERTSRIPVVMMTTASEVALLPAHLDRLTKPFDRQTVLAKIGARLGGEVSREVTDERKPR